MRIISRNDKLLKDLISIAKHCCYDVGNIDDHLEYIGAITFATKIMEKYPVMFSLKEMNDLTIMKTYTKIKTYEQNK